MEGRITVPRLADPKSKTLRLVLAAKPEEEIRVRAFKMICARNNIEIRDVLMEKVDDFLQEHHWPPGNSQTVLPVFGAAPEKQCGLCGHFFPKLTKILCISGLVTDACDSCVEDCRKRRTLKKVLRGYETQNVCLP